MLFSNDDVQDEKGNFLIKDQEMAIELAQIYWEPVYGKKRIKSRKPFSATISNDSIWIVKGRLPKKRTKGGSPYIEINAYSGEVYVMSFGK